MTGNAARAVLGAAMLVAACGGGDARDAAGADTMRSIEPALAQHPEPPAPPPARSGQVAGLSAGEIAIEGAWPATAGACEDPALLQVLVDRPDIGVLVLVRFSPAGAGAGVYPLGPLEDGGLPPPGGARVAVQILEDPDPIGLFAVSGEVELTRVGRRASGGVSGVFVDAGSQRQVGFSASFADIPSHQLPHEECRLAATAADTTAPPDTGRSADTTGGD